MAKDKISKAEKNIDKYINSKGGKLTPKEAASLTKVRMRFRKERLSD